MHIRYNYVKKIYILNKNHNSFKKTSTISKIFEDHWLDVYSNNKVLIDIHRPNKKTSRLSNYPLLPIGEADGEFFVA